MTTSTTAELQESNPTSNSSSNILSSDLFEGELHGDELTDIYISAATVTVPTSCSEGVISEDEIPLFLPHVSDCDDETKKSDTDVHSDQSELLPKMATVSDSNSIIMGNSIKSPQNTNTTAVTEQATNTIESCDTKRVHDGVALEDNMSVAKKQCTQAGESLTTSSDHVALCSGGAIVPKPTSAVDGTTLGNNSSNGNDNVPSAISNVPKPLLTSETVVNPVSPVNSSTTTSSADPTSSNTTITTIRPKVTTTEADFKAVAQAAVSKLIKNVGNHSATGLASVVKVGEPRERNRGVIVTDTASGIRTQNINLTPDERTKQNRDRNREHARNTRLRKKAYVEELKRVLAQLAQQRDSSEAEKQQIAQRNIDQREVRFRVIEEFFKLRGRNETDFALWSAIIEDNHEGPFILTLPVTRFREMVHDVNKQDDVIPEQQSLCGVSEVMADSNYLASFLQSLGKGVNYNESMPLVKLDYHCHRKDFFMDGTVAVLDWSASSVGAIDQGAIRELSLKGTIRAKFNPASNKLLSATIYFDTGMLAWS